MPINYDSLKQTAERLISENGGTISYTINAEGTSEYDPTTGQIVVTGGTSETVEFSAVLVRYNKQEGFVPDSTILKNALKVLVAGDVPIQAGDNVSIDSTQYKIVYKDVTKPNVSDVILTTMVVSL